MSEMDRFDLIMLITGLVLLRIPFRSRKPKTIYAHRNWMYNVTYFVMIAPYASMIIMSSIRAHFGLSESLYMTVVLTIAFGAVLYFVYALWLSRPYSRNRTGVAAVDLAVKRYKKPGEVPIGIIKGWTPDLVVEGKVYKLFAYYEGGSPPAGILMLDLAGNVVRERALADKIHRCFHLAVGAVIHPDARNQRTAQYEGICKGRKQYRKLFGGGKWKKRWRKLLEEKAEYVQLLEEMFEALDIVHEEEMESMLALLEEEARVANALGGTGARRIPYEAIESIERRWQEHAKWLIEHVEITERGVRAAKRLKRTLLKEVRGRLQEELAGMIDAALAIGNGPERTWKESGEIPPHLKPLFGEYEAAWLSRLEWVDQVDEWYRQGLSEEEVEAKKREVLGVDEKERVRMERRRRWWRRFFKKGRKAMNKFLIVMGVLLFLYGLWRVFEGDGSGWYRLGLGAAIALNGFALEQQKRGRK